MQHPKGIILFLILFFSGSSELLSQGSGCELSFQQDTISIQCGDTVTLSPIEGSTQLGDNFDNKKLDSGWSSTQPVDFDNPCPPSSDGTPYAWMGPEADNPRILTTEQMDLSCGGQICLDLKMGVQSDPSPCEGPGDDVNEGVHLQWSTDNGSTWNEIFYFDPDSCASGGFGCYTGSPGPSIYHSWRNYCFNVPPSAQTDTTKFRLYQAKVTDTVYDHWGVDNVFITGSSCDSIIAYSYDSINYDTSKKKDVAPTTNKNYQVWAITDTTGAGDTCTAQVYVNVTGVPDLNVTASDSSIVCMDTIQLNASHNTSGPISYQWSPDHQLSNDTVQNPRAWPFKDTAYQAIAHIPGKPACADTGSVPISVNCDTCFPPNPDLTMPSCNGDNDGKIVANMVGPRPPFNVVWKDSTGTVLAQDSPVYPTDTLDGLASGEYTISTTDTLLCTADTTFILPEPDSIQVSTSDDTLICKGGTAQIRAYPSGGNGPPYTFNWSGGLPDTATHEVNPNNQTNYSVTVQDSNGCTSPSASVKVDIYPDIFVNTKPDDTICPGGTAQLDVISTTGGSGSGYSYTWTNGAGDTVGTGASTTVQPSTTMNYVVHVDDDCETPEATDTLTISIYQGQAGANVKMAVSPKDSCYPLNADFTCLVPSNKVSSTFWSFGDGTTSNDSGTTQHTYNQPGCYDVTLEVTSTKGCTEDSTFVDAVCARPHPKANFVMEPRRGDVLDPELFLADRSAGAVDYLWSFEHVDSTSTLPELEMVFPNDTPGTYEVTQWVENQYGCTDSITKTVIIEGVHQLYVPNAFTPDGDGINDIFRPEGEGFAEEKYHFRIFDRWGKLVFKTKDPEEGWDGTIDGQKARPGVYVWQIQVKDAYTDQVHNKEGHVTLIR